MIKKNKNKTKKVIFSDLIRFKLTFINFFFCRQKFDQDSINYCDFDPDRLSSKLGTSSSLWPSPIQPLSHLPPHLRPNFNVNIFLRGGVFNQSSQITGKHLV